MQSFEIILKKKRLLINCTNDRGKHSPSLDSVFLRGRSEKGLSYQNSDFRVNLFSIVFFTNFVKFFFKQKTAQRIKIRPLKHLKTGCIERKSIRLKSGMIEYFRIRLPDSEWPSSAHRGETVWKNKAIGFF